MKNIILMVVLAGLLLSASTCFAQELTDWEREVYYDYLEEYYTSPFPRDEVYIDEVIASRHGISVDRLVDILDKGIDREPTQREWGIHEELWDQLAALGNNVSVDDYTRVYQRVAGKYGITLRQLYEIEYRTFSWAMGGWQPD
ncbi:hypothetical protein ACFL5C_00245 [Candidatus Omnitrophota bacterium]